MCRKAVTCLMEEMPVFDMLRSGMSRSAVGHDEFNINEATEY